MGRLGINGMGRIGKLTVWEQVYRKHFDGLVVNLGRRVGVRLEDIVETLSRDTTYGTLARYLHGISGGGKTIIVDRDAGLVEVHGMPVKFLTTSRNPKDIGWGKEGVRLVVDTTGAFNDPSEKDAPRGSLWGHLEAGAHTVINSAPFKIRGDVKKMPDECTMLIHGINHLSFDPGRHCIVSAASCTTTGLAHMIKPLLETSETSKILTASMSTIHAATNSQSVLDSVPRAGAVDLRKNRQVFNNIILSSTGAARALEQVIPEIAKIGFMADSVRVPTNTVSLINLNVTFQADLDDRGEALVDRDRINDIYRKASEGSQKGLLVYSDRQNVSSDISGTRAAVTIEGHENHIRVGFMEISPGTLRQYGIETDRSARIPVTHAKIFGWYDNELGSYVYCLGELAVHVDRMTR